ncbi:MarR family transcriptional regulator [Lachnospiraceae bacterium OF09-6]|nr:MarR family transcriptional regulator [Lachnospiraceae bacterium OF09-6]
MEKEKQYHYTAEEVFSLFQCLTSRIENGHPNILELGDEKEHFFRGEIHMLRMIGVDPGIHSSELARKFGVSRAVTAKIIQKLLQKGVIES